jgi:hypothetical protein
MPLNFVKITMHPDRFDLWPPCPEVVAATEPLNVGIDWDKDPGTWEQVRVENFVRADGEPVAITGTAPVFHRNEKNVVKRVDFEHFQSDDHYCKYDLVFKQLGSEKTLTVDPTLLLKKLG